jgi:hypothetical protein
MPGTLRACVILSALAAPLRSHAEPPVRVPPGTHSDAQGQLISGRGLRDTSDFLAAELARRGIAAQQIGPSGVRGVELTRFLSQTPSTPWLAIHVLRAGGKTLIFFVPRAKSATTP